VLIQWGGSWVMDQPPLLNNLLVLGFFQSIMTQSPPYVIRLDAMPIGLHRANLQPLIQTGCQRRTLLMQGVKRPCAGHASSSEARISVFLCTYPNKTLHYPSRVPISCAK
jgi:hypothetical protein